MAFSYRREHAGEDLEAEVLLVSKAVCSALDDPDLVVESLDEAERDFVLRATVGGDPLPVTVDHSSELLEGLKVLPLQGVPPVLEEPPCPPFATVFPELAERFLEQVGDVDPLVRLEQEPQGAFPVEGQVRPVGQECIALPFDELPVFSRQPGILAATHLVHGLAQMAQGVELVVQAGGLRGVSCRGVLEGLPHVHHGQPDTPALFITQLLEEQVHADLRTVVPPEPDRTLPHQIADDDAVGVALADGQLVDADDLRPRRPHPAQLLGHVLLLQGLDRLPVQVGFPGDILDGHYPASPADPEGKPLGVERRVGQPVQLLLLHLPAAPTEDSSHLHVQVNASIPAGEVPHPAHLPVVEDAMHSAANPAGRFFPRRRSRMTRTYGSPKTPLTTDSGIWPGNRYASSSRLIGRIPTAYHFRRLLESRFPLDRQQVACA